MYRKELTRFVQKGAARKQNYHLMSLIIFFMYNHSRSLHKGSLFDFSIYFRATSWLPPLLSMKFTLFKDVLTSTRRPSSRVQLRKSAMKGVYSLSFLKRI
ncbi:unnamed protein product [Cuscuta epithymum]|uniref:Uncharacterized protein n=1 Tax=Cuscuta epithymum TaxID=186058 RepID=A0AAV0EZB8_9ASTE|nr:unnamed protein product [Cuscuta epithymum]